MSCNFKQDCARRDNQLTANAYSSDMHLHSCARLPQVVIFNRGRIEQQGSPNDIIKNPRTPFIMKFVGDTNAVPATAQVCVF